MCCIHWWEMPYVYVGYETRINDTIQMFQSLLNTRKSATMTTSEQLMLHSG